MAQFDATYFIFPHNKEKAKVDGIKSVLEIEFCYDRTKILIPFHILKKLVENVEEKIDTIEKEVLSDDSKQSD